MNWLDIVNECDLKSLGIECRSVKWLDGTHNSEIAAACREFMSVDGNLEKFDFCSVWSGTGSAIRHVVREAVLMLDAEFVASMRDFGCD